MKKGFLCILLSLLMIMPLLTACNKEADLTGSEVNIYTLYTIVGEETSPEAIRQVELSLNRILFYRLGVILDLQMVTEDKYDEFLASKFAELEAYQADKSNNPYAENIEKYPGIMTGDRVLDMLENGEDIVLKRPRVDVFLVRGYEDYYELASNQELAELDEKMNNECKDLKSQIHTTLRDAAKVNGKTYGIPINTGIGEYMQLVFDAEMVDKYGLKLETVESLEDLEGFLKQVKEGETDVIPLMNASVPTGFNFIINDGFPALVSSNGDVIDAYTNPKLRSFFAMLAKYNALGYIKENPDEGARCAVRIVAGTDTEIEAKFGKNTPHKQYSAPIATNANTLKNLFCIPASVVSNELTEVVKIINEVNTDAELMNLLTYGVQKTHGVEIAHYELNDDNQVERIKENLYVVDPQYIGNCFITYTLDGEPADKWEKLITQNKLAIPSPTLGFSMAPVTFTYTEKVQNEDGTVEIKTVTIYEPDYASIVNSVVEKYYPSLMNGSFISSTDFNYEEYITQKKAEIRDNLIAELDKAFANRLFEQFKAEARDELINNDSDSIKSEAADIVLNEDISNARDYFESSLDMGNSEASEESSEDSAAIEESSEVADSSVVEENSSTEETSEPADESNSVENSEANDSSVADESAEEENELISDEFVLENINQYYEANGITQENIDERVAKEYNKLLDSKAEATATAKKGTSEYERRFNELKATKEYTDAVAAIDARDVDNKANTQLDLDLSNKYVKPYTEAMINEINVAIETAVNDFIATLAEKRRAEKDGDVIVDTSTDESTEVESSEIESTEAESTEAESAEAESAEAESTEAESTEAESTEAESSESESSESESSEPESSTTEIVKDEHYKAVEEEVYLAIGYWEKTTVTPEDDANGEASEGETTEAESTEAESTETESSDESSETSAEEGEGDEEGETQEVITKPYPTWLDFVVKGKVAKAYYQLHPKK